LRIGFRFHLFGASSIGANPGSFEKRGEYGADRSNNRASNQR
jgi:hypothetical protein